MEKIATTNSLTHSLTLLKIKNTMFLVDFTKFLLLCFGLLWKVDLQYDKSKAHTSRFPDIVEKMQAGFKNPKSYGHCMKAVNILSLISKVTKLATHLEKKLCHQLTQNLSKI